MFTGIVEEIGTIKQSERRVHSAVITVKARTVLGGICIGDSIAVNGVCLTVVGYTDDQFFADIMHETLERSSLQTAKSGDTVNLERAMPADGRFGGHFVAGHVDGIGIITAIERDDTAVWYTLRTEPSVLRYIVEKGSIAMDGISLTVAKVDETCFSVSLIPHTVGYTTLGSKRVGDSMNLENDVIGKYVEKLLLPQETPKKSAITKEFLLQNGF